MKVIDIDARGLLKLPKELMEKFGIQPGGQLVLEETSEGLLLKSNSPLSVEMYSEERLAEFSKNNEEALSSFRLKK